MTFDSRLLSGIGVLSAVIEAGSFVRAGEALGLTQSAVSRAVARLEQRIGITIFRRTARSITLTDEGRRFYEAVAPHLTSIEDAAIEAGGSSAKVTGRLRITSDGAFGQYVLAPNIAGFLARHPELTLELAIRDRIGDLVAEGFDVAVRFGLPEPSSLTGSLLLETRVLTCASPEYVARHGQPLHPNDMTAHQCILLRNPATGRHYDWLFQRGEKSVPVNVSGQLMVNDTGSLLGACLGGQGIGQPLELYAREFVADGRLVQLLPDWADETFPLYAYHHSPHLMSAKVRAFLAFLRELTA
ncbi:MAG TPA: LysR family transcriptional regulator [Devosiaceae bacterium]|jgi:DNA-binding transcriptional LysR family regulator